MVGLRDFTLSRKLRRCSLDSISGTLRRFSGTDCHLHHSGLDASNPPRSTHTHPSVPIHLAPIAIAPLPPAMVILTSTGYRVTSLRYRQLTVYLVAVFQTASAAGNSPNPSTSD